jgi:predicted O-linked N-acetylglucosamine transferase (SPINDLY family)
MAAGTNRFAEADRLLASGALIPAGELYAAILEKHPDHAEAWCRLGQVYHGLGQPDKAAGCYRRALALRPGLIEALSNLGLALLHGGNAREAVNCLREAVRLRPEWAEIHNNLGMALTSLDNQEEAAFHFRQAVQRKPGLAAAHNNLGLALAGQGMPDEALACYERAAQLAPESVGALANLGNAYKDLGRLGDAVRCYRQALALQPGNARIHSNLLLALSYQPGAEPLEILREARHYAERHAAPSASTIPPHPVRSGAEHRLRIGYVSGDFRDHPVAYFFEPILASHDHRRFEIFCYADVQNPDDTTQRLQRHADCWRSLVGLSDEQAAALIRQDQIDILVDLAGHTGGNRLPVFARKPAPVQASYLGYLGTTGLAAIDYYITDAHTDPPGLTEAHFQERLLRLPECAFCYQPGDAPEAGTDLPARRNGRVTFASLNTLAKLSEEVLALWAQVLTAVPGSRLMLPRGGSGRACDWLCDVLARHGISTERLFLLDKAATRLEYLKRYEEIDLCLDPFPYNGVTTTCDALWMGVPVVTLAGRSSVSRLGVRFLRSVGLEELIAPTPATYVRLATELAGDQARLEALRSGLRERVAGSPLMDGPRLTSHLEALYRGMRDEWVIRQGPAGQN